MTSAAEGWNSKFKRKYAIRRRPGKIGRLERFRSAGVISPVTQPLQARDIGEIGQGGRWLEALQKTAETLPSR